MCQFVLIKHFEKEKKFRHLPIVVMDVGYSNEVIKFKTFYKNLEDLLASSVQSTKYQSRQFTWKTPPFVIIVSNHPSQVEHLSADRLVPYAIDDKPGHVLMEDTLTLKKLKDFADKQSKSAAQRSERIRSGPGSVQPLPHPPLGALQTNLDIGKHCLLKTTHHRIMFCLHRYSPPHGFASSLI